ncbi:hypothetical protein HMPREF1978_01451 [Actinomyces graevenitzii F0530]|uniref:Uncharacterized protein n=1 Tax=Actinomyces graevenitzii F0530 TaxID=1321817 RepID=U1PDN8_9ACTO|nr:hypothetical protein HMPREF1978_01451 [Actinomyces graevenitzii F0530]
MKLSKRPILAVLVKFMTKYEASYFYFYDFRQRLTFVMTML